MDFPAGTLELFLVDGKIRIDRADEVVAISAELLREMRKGTHEDVEFRQAPGQGYPDATVTIQGTNRTVTYKVTSNLAAHGFYVLERVGE